MAGPALGDGPAPRLRQLADAGDEWCELLNHVNGFYAFESALHVFPSGTTERMSVERWNKRNLWRQNYEDLADGLLFFAEDVLGGQFAFAEDGVCAFDPETGAREVVAEDLEHWAEAIIDDCEVLTAYPLAHDWQRRHGPLAPGQRLVPATPFFAGGEFDVENLYAIDAVQGMRARGAVALQIRGLPDDAKIRFKVVD